MTEKNLTKADFYFGAVLMTFGICVMVFANQMPKIPKDPYSSPGLLPVILGIIITALSFILLVRSLIRTRGKIGLSGLSLKSLVKEVSTIRIVVTVAICLGYVILLGKIIFPVLTFLFIFFFIFCFEYDFKMQFRPQIKKILMAALVALLTSAAITSVFRYLFLVRLP